MIVCPICNKKVINYYRGTIPKIAVNEEFECPTIINSQSHYFKSCNYITKEMYTVAIIPPYQLTWINNKTIVKLIKSLEVSETIDSEYSDLIVVPNIPNTFNDINEFVVRLNNLIPFI